MLQTKMGTITSRRRKDGATADWAQLGGMRDGERVYQEAKAFDRKPAAQAGIRRRENELAEPSAQERSANHQR